MNTYNNFKEEMEFECNECNISEIFYGSFIDCIKEAKLKGWIISKENGKYGDWVHFCNDECATKWGVIKYE